jgi:hypothetical protein
MARSPENALVFNARGVAHAYGEQPTKARADFDDAICYSNGSLADAFANVGAYCIQVQEGAPGAHEAYDQAIRLSAKSSSGFALALHGRGCAGLILGKKESIDDLENAIRSAPCEELKEFMLRNTAKCEARARGVDADDALVKINKTGAFVGTKIGGFVGGKVGGVEIDPDQINWDEGDWPFDEAYGLMCSASRKQ